jgi:hypothetical protein
LNTLAQAYTYGLHLTGMLKAASQRLSSGPVFPQFLCMELQYSALICDRDMIEP